jgi:hypothetical protein
MARIYDSATSVHIFLGERTRKYVQKGNMKRASASEPGHHWKTDFDDDVEGEIPAHTSVSHREHVERTRAPWYSYRKLRGKDYAKKADLEANVIHYVLQYARIVNEILRVPRIPDKEAEAETKKLTDAFKLCIQKNIDNAVEDASSACCVRSGVQFEACRDLSRKLLASLKELKAFLMKEDKDSDAFEAFVKKHLSSKELSSLWSLGRVTSRGLVVTAAAVLLVLAYQYGVFPAAAEMLHLDAGLGSRILEALRNGGSGLYQGVGNVRASVVELLRPIQESLMISNIMGAATGLGAGVSQGVSRFLHGDASGLASQPAPAGFSPKPIPDIRDLFDRAPESASHHPVPHHPVPEPLGFSRKPIPDIRDLFDRAPESASHPSVPGVPSSLPSHVHSDFNPYIFHHRIGEAPGNSPRLSHDALDPYISPHRLISPGARAGPHDNSKALVVYHAVPHHTTHPIARFLQPDPHHVRHHHGGTSVITDNNITPGWRSFREG